MAIPLFVDFTPVGLNYVWQGITHAQINDAAFLRSQIQVVDDSDLQIVMLPPLPGRLPTYRMENEVTGVPGTPPSLSRIVMNGETYAVRAYKGAGVYGTNAEVEDLATGRRYCLKRQDTAVSGHLLGQIHEGMIHYTLFKMTEDITGSSLYVPSFYRIGIRGNILYFLVELMNQNLERTLSAVAANINNQARAIHSFYRQIVPKLDFFFNECKYNHGDFKIDNVMSDFTGNYKLIDFGFSRVQFSVFPLMTTYLNNMSEKSRDLTQMTKVIDMFVDFNGNYKNRPGLPHNMYLALKMRLLRRAICDGKDGDHPPHLKNMDLVPWLQSYEWFNSSVAGQPGLPPTWPIGHRNVAGTFDAIRGYLQWMTDPANSVYPTIPIPLTVETTDAEAIIYPGGAPAGLPLGPAIPPPLPPAAAIVPPAAAVAPPAAAIVPAVAPPPAAVAAVVPAPVVVPGPGAPAPLPAPVNNGIVALIQNNAGLLLGGLAMGAAFILHPFLFGHDSHEGGRRLKKLSRKTRKNRKVRQKHKYVSRKSQRSFH